MIFALDARLTDYHIKQWKLENDVIVSQRGAMDCYAHGHVWGVTYEQANELYHMDDLVKPEIAVHLNARADVAWGRIKDDKNADKFETPAYLEKQSWATEQVYKDIMGGHKALKNWATVRHIYLDTTKLSMRDTHEIVRGEIGKVMSI
jgi:thymidylate kinase